MGSGFSKMKKQARLLEEQYQKSKVERKASLYTGSAGNGLVTITLNGDKEIQSLSIQPDCVDPKDVEGLQDLICRAYSEAWKQIEEKEKDSLPSFPMSF